jgi:hypothetical protein
MVNELKKQLRFVIWQRWQYVRRVTKFSALSGLTLKSYVLLVLRYIIYGLLALVLLVVSVLLFEGLESFPVLLVALALIYFFAVRILHKLKAHEYRNRSWSFRLLHLFYGFRYVFYGVAFILASVFVFGNLRGELLLLIFVATVLLLKILWGWRGEQFAFGKVPMVALGLTLIASPVFAPLWTIVIGAALLYGAWLGVGKFKRRYTYRGRTLHVQEQILEELRKRNL